MRRAGLALAASIVAMASLTACGGGGSAEDFCKSGEDLESIDPGSSDVQDAMDEAVDNAPDEIKDDVETLRDAFEDYDPEDPESTADLDMDEVQKATKNVGDYVSENCEE